MNKRSQRNSGYSDTFGHAMKSILRRSDRESKQQGNKIATQNCQSRDPTETYLMRCFQYANPISVSRNLRQNGTVFYSAIRDGVAS